jgi:transcriptional regulator with XRE-family HTH domain
MEIKDKIKAARATKKITQKELASLIGVTQATITKIETGETKNPSVDIALKIADALGEDVYNLFTDESSNRTPLNITEQEIDRLKILVIESIYKYESNQIFLKQFEYDHDNNKEELEKFIEYKILLSQIRQGIFETFINMGICSQDDISRFYANKLKQSHDKIWGTDSPNN